VESPIPECDTSLDLVNPFPNYLGIFTYVYVFVYVQTHMCAYVCVCEYIQTLVRKTVWHSSDAGL